MYTHWLSRASIQGGEKASHTRIASVPQFIHKHRLAAKRSLVALPEPQPIYLPAKFLNCKYLISVIYY